MDLGEFPIQNFLNLGNVGGNTRNPIVNDFDGDGDMDFIGITNGNSNVGCFQITDTLNYYTSLMLIRLTLIKRTSCC